MVQGGAVLRIYLVGGKLLREQYEKGARELETTVNLVRRGSYVHVEFVKA